MSHDSKVNYAICFCCKATNPVSFSGDWSHICDDCDSVYQLCEKCNVDHLCWYCESDHKASDKCPHGEQEEEASAKPRKEKKRKADEDAPLTIGEKARAAYMQALNRHIDLVKQLCGEEKGASHWEVDKKSCRKWQQENTEALLELAQQQEFEISISRLACSLRINERNWKDTFAYLRHEYGIDIDYEEPAEGRWDSGFAKVGFCEPEKKKRKT
jgi:hypothetical protein